MHRLVVLALLLFFTLSLVAAEPEYSRDIAKWQDASMPPVSKPYAREAWILASNNSAFEWRVFSDSGKPCVILDTNRSAQQGTGIDEARSERPKFEVGDFHEAYAYTAVSDGWLVGFNEGEFGAALYWFSLDGTQNYKISDHQVVGFVSLPDGIYAIEGLAHLCLSEGSVIRIARTDDGSRWQAVSVVQLPFAPYAVSLRPDGTMLITLSEALVSVGLDRKVHTLLADTSWSMLYPNSSILSPDARFLYIGMRQFVGEFDLKTNKLRFLVPSKAFLKGMPTEEEIEKRYGFWAQFRARFHIPWFY